MRRLLWILPFLIGLWMLAAPSVFADSHEIVLLEADGVVSAGMANYVARGVDSAETSNAHAIILQLDTPGGDVESMFNIVSAIRNSSIPVIVYVAPEGATAGSAGSVITFAGHIAAMAPDTAIGAASPVQATGEDIAETLYKKQVEILTAEVRSLTERRGEEAMALAESMITDAEAVSHSEALAIGLVDVVAVDLDDLLQAVDGMSYTIRGEEGVLDSADATLATITISVLERLQMALVSSALAGMLLSIGFLGLVWELRAPGGYIAGAIGIMCLGLGLYSLGQIPTNLFGLGLLVLAFILFFLETTTPTYGVLSLGGVIALVGGLWVMFNTTDVAWARLTTQGLIGATLPVILTFVTMAVALARTHRNKPMMGKRGMIGAEGVAKKDFKPFGTRFRGTVFVMGELWKAEADEMISAEIPITVEAINGMTVHVQPKP